MSKRYSISINVTDVKDGKNIVGINREASTLLECALAMIDARYLVEAQNMTELFSKALDEVVKHGQAEDA